ncbi:MAG: M48 family metallopeptidase [Lachnospiraceae bacterium]|nr:M48 family metallopeptidase [Lachnospiraceae bacterium]
MFFHYKTPETTYQYRIIRSNRKSISIQIKENGDVEVRAPHYVSDRQIDKFVESKQDWILEKRQEVLAHYNSLPTLSPEEEARIGYFEKKFRKAAKDYIPYRVEYFHQFTGGHYTSITIRDQKSRWGSCSGSGTLSFNYRLMMAPPKILDYVVVHELCHLTHMNHSKDFWNMVGTILPDYKESKQWLKEHGRELTVPHYLAKMKQ